MSPRGIFTHVGIILHILDCLGQDMQVLYLGRAPRTKETLLDFLKWRRVTRHPLVFHGLTGSQRTPGFWGVTTDVAKVRWFENGLRLSIRARIVGLRLQDMDSMVGTALTIEKDMEDARNTRDASVSGKRKDSQSSSSSGKRQRASSSRGSQSHGHSGQGQMRVTGQAGQMRVASQAGQMVCYHC